MSDAKISLLNRHTLLSKCYVGCSKGSRETNYTDNKCKKKNKSVHFVDRILIVSEAITSTVNFNLISGMSYFLFTSLCYLQHVR